jgi:fructokinase
MNINGHLHVHPGFSLPVSDTTGSGDAFLAGLLYKMSNSVPMEESQVYANAVGALVASKPGSCPGYTTQEIERIISNNKNVTLPSHL